MYIVRTGKPPETEAERKSFEDGLNQLAKQGIRLAGLSSAGKELLIVLDASQFKESGRGVLSSIRSLGSGDGLLGLLNTLVDVDTVPTASIPAKALPTRSKTKPNRSKL